ncbi:class I adenylate-forming enzyme family protein [Streptomyces sp. NPDC044571]|uniref:class I adenylate-forming enzyme family protein n=1 Tax=Streptomyces sp. NPDC044571 TaxID=3155371 RepID=UPI0033D7F517
MTNKSAPAHGEGDMEAASRLVTALHEAALRWPERPAITFQGRTLSYLEFWARAGALAAACRSMGVTAGDRIVCQLPNSPEYLVAVAAAWRCGAVLVGADHDLTGPELVSLLGRTGAVALVYRPRRAAEVPVEPLDDVRRECPGVRLIVHDDERPRPREFRLADLTDLTGRPGDPVPAEAPAPGVDDSGTALLLLTSGTTGQPKCVVETFDALSAKLDCFSSAYRPGESDVHLVYLPLAHALGLKMSMIALTRGSRLVLMERFSPAGALRLITDEGVTVVPGTPAHFQLMLDTLDPAVHDLSTLRWAVAGAASFPGALLTALYTTFGVRLFYVYGCSEGFLCHTVDRTEIEAGSVGRTVFQGPPGTAPNGRVAIFARDGSGPVGPGEVGEIVFGADRPVRYWGQDPVAADGWYHTGDLGLVDEEGRLHVKGRMKELVNRGGLKVSCAEVESAVTALPGVVDCGIFPVPDRVLGEAIGAYVVLAPGEPEFRVEELRARLGRSLARHKMPDALWIVDRVPRTKIGKVDRAALRLVPDAAAAGAAG